ncbi:hypothetical protein CDL15_Pgr004340 [Punica granatum]|uniref:Uncharacterized protein n=1 Tax=Punica granatum TaxID=22663 RepID=A0A218XGV0_PUNGR|nr:hypothetical protein CDL15_Pgr004340 [Punica granatum]PKI54759.1 hypothetical protein CRG98_024861 [Punica granatum]
MVQQYVDCMINAAGCLENIGDELKNIEGCPPSIGCYLESIKCCPPSMEDYSEEYLASLASLPHMPPNPTNPTWGGTALTDEGLPPHGRLDQASPWRRVNKPSPMGGSDEPLPDRKARRTLLRVMVLDEQPPVRKCSTPHP